MNGGFDHGAVGITTQVGISDQPAIRFRHDAGTGRSRSHRKARLFGQGVVPIETLDLGGKRNDGLPIRREIRRTQ